MNCVAAFLYQLMDYNEEETFYLFYSLLENSKYHEKDFQINVLTFNKLIINK